jgi:circadian clock protein KaiB
MSEPGDVSGSAPAQGWTLTLYVNGASANSLRSIESIRQLCDQELNGQVDLEIIDVRQEPALIVRDQVLAAPTLVRRLPEPLRRIVGDLSDPDRLRAGLDLGPVPAGEPPVDG